MTSSISSAYSSPFQISGELGLGTASLLGGDATNSSPNASTLLASTASTTGPLAALSAAKSNALLDETTVLALGEGRLTGSQHKAIAALGTAPKGTYNFDWAKGNEPTVLATARKLGWIKLVKPTYDQATRFVTSADYVLTTIGKAIYKRTDNAVATGPNSEGALTLDSLGAGKITTDQQDALSTIAQGQAGKRTFKWTQGQEPSLLTGLRKNGWVQFIVPNYNTLTHEFDSASYKLTDLGKKIYNVSTALAASATQTTSTSASVNTTV